MSDERLRELGRRWKASGGVEDEARYYLQGVRTGLLPRAALEIVAALGDEAARRASQSLSPVVLVVHFCASWNGYDALMSEQLEALWEEGGGWILQALDTGQQPGWSLAASLDVTNVPTLIAFRCGAEVGRLVGLAEPRRLADWLREVQDVAEEEPPPGSLAQGRG